MKTFIYRSATHYSPSRRIPDWEDLMQDLVAKERQRKLDLRMKGREQFKKRNRRKI
jgi:hypothetical protein